MTHIESGSRYIITNVKGNTVVDLSGADNKSIIGYTRHGGPNQQWETTQVDGGWHIKNVASGTYLAIEGQAGDGQVVVATSEPYLWHLWDDQEDASVIRICVPNTTQNVDLSDHGNPAPGTPVTLWGRWNGKNQVWKFEKV